MKLPSLFLVAALFHGCLNLAFGQTATLFTVEENGPRAQRINLVFLSEGYTSVQMGTFASDVNDGGRRRGGARRRQRGRAGHDDSISTEQ